MGFLVCTGHNVLLGSTMGPATFLVDTTTGKIIEIQRKYNATLAILPDTNHHRLDAQQNYVLPGLVECVKRH